MNWNIQLLGKMCGITLLITGMLFIPSAIIAFAFEEHAHAEIFIFSSIIFSSLGLISVKKLKGNRKHIKVREGYLGIILCTVLASLVGSVPFFLSNPETSMVDAVFESVAGISTTSATVVGEHLMPKSLLFWKASQHWIGGLGILIFIVAIMPMLGAGEQQLSTAENQGTTLNKIAPRSRTIIKYLISVYVFLSLASFVYFMLCRIGSFDALILSLCCTSTSGVLLHPEGISYYNNMAVEMGVSLFCILGGISFVLYIHIIKKHFYVVKNNVELKVFLYMIVISTITVFAILYANDEGSSSKISLSDAFFQVSSFATTSGFALKNYTIWPTAAKFILFSLMLVGGCSSSTTGAFRTIRAIIVFKLVKRGIFKRIHPRAVKAVNVGKSVISAKMVSSVTTFSIVYAGIILFSILVLSLQNQDIETTVSAAVGSISNDGISFGAIGMDGDYSRFNAPLKLYLSFLMLVGRLGLLNIFILFLPSFWNPNKRTKIQ